MNLSDLTSLEVLMLTIYGEARGEPIAGQVAVGCVIRNRVREAKSNYSAICLAPKQFSCWNENDPNRAVLLELAEKMIATQTIDDIHLRQCQWVASGVINGWIIDNTAGAMNYLATELFQAGTISWAKNAKNISTRGNHIFFNV